MERGSCYAVAQLSYSEVEGGTENDGRILHCKSALPVMTLGAQAMK